jgi:putative Flp pilus-assembly TadE/G-like protein
MIPAYKCRPDIASERGAVIVHVAIALLGLMAISTFVIDYGVMWTARRQAQNSADAGALAGAISLAFIDFNNQGMARDTALNVAGVNNVWGQSPDITPGDVTFPMCPPGSPGAGTNSCIRVDVFRNQRAGGSPLPTFFGTLVGINEQGVRATATAGALFGNSTDCVKPFAIPDKWLEQNNDQGPAGWSETDTYERRNRDGSLMVGNPGLDDYGGGAYGYTPATVGLGGGDHGRYMKLKAGSPGDAIAPGWFHPVVINPSEGPGGSNYRDNIATCDPTVIGPGTQLDVEPGNMIGPTKQGMRELWEQDRLATWDPDLYGSGRGGVTGGCMGTTPATCVVSPRLVAIPVFDPDAYDAGRASGRITINVVKVLGFFIDQIQGNDVYGYITTYPSRPNQGMGGVPGNNFVVSVALVR